MELVFTGSTALFNIPQKNNMISAHSHLFVLKLHWYILAEEGVFRRSTHYSNKEAAISVISQRGEQDCARRTNAMGF